MSKFHELTGKFQNASYMCSRGVHFEQREAKFYHQNDLLALILSNSPNACLFVLLLMSLQSIFKHIQNADQLVQITHNDLESVFAVDKVTTSLYGPSKP